MVADSLIFFIQKLPQIRLSFCQTYLNEFVVLHDYICVFINQLLRYVFKSSTTKMMCPNYQKSP